MSAIPFRRLLGVAVAHLGLSPARFWAMTPRELSAALEARFGAPSAPPPRHVLAALMRRFPDEGVEDGRNPR